MYDPKTHKYPYPERTDGHYLKVKKNKGIAFDAKYPYVDTSESFLRKKALMGIVFKLLVLPFAKIWLALKTEGKENVKKYKAVIDKGIISCCNHVHLFDFLGIMQTVKPHKPFVLIWAKNINGENGTSMRFAGGIPIPENDLGGTLAYSKAIGKLLTEGGWLHIYPEGSMWEYYAPIRPFKLGAAYFACKYDKPVLPMAYSYRKPGWFGRTIFGKIALFTLRIGEPIYPDKSLEKEARVKDLNARVHAEICSLAGIDPDKNIYPPLYENSKRIDYYD